MDFVSYSISHNGLFLFRTDKQMAMDWPLNFESLLAAKFPASEGYRITREIRPNNITSEQINN